MNSIIKENYWKLKQNNRIEYLLLNNRINENKVKGYSPFSIWVTLINCYVLIFFSLIYYSIFNKLPYLQWPFIIILFVGYIVLSFLIDIIGQLKYNKEIEELNKRFFEVRAAK